MRQAYDRLGDIVLVIDNGAGDFIPPAFECCDRSDFGHAPNLGRVPSECLWRLRHNTGHCAVPRSKMLNRPVGRQWAKFVADVEATWLPSRRQRSRSAPRSLVSILKELSTSPTAGINLARIP